MNFDITKAVKDAQYHETRTSEERAQLPQNTIGALELTDEALEAVSGACGANIQTHHNFSYAYQFKGSYHFNGYHQPQSHCDHHHHSGGHNWFGGWQHPSCFDKHHGNCH